MARRLAERGAQSGGGVMGGGRVLCVLRRAGRGAASGLVRAAGRAFGRSQASERGTILLLVIGVLAMMSIITVVYVTIGQGDRRGAAALQREVRLDDQATAIADYLAGVLRDDLFTVIEEQSLTPGGQPRLYRETTDYPWMNDRVMSIPGPSDPPELAFNPAGTGYLLTTLSGTPTKLAQGGDPWLSATEPAFLPTAVNRNPPLPDSLRLLDWPQISNFSPTGLFVNLYALRPGAGGFYASPGTGDFAPGAGIETSEYLTLFDPAGGQPQALGTQTLPDGSPADPYKPAHWTRNQVWMYRPAFDLDARPNQPTSTPGDPRFLPYQYADADGDGMFDSRWWEPLRWDGERFSPIIRSESQARLFIAARCIDLSGLVNVQTAADFEKGPTVNQPAGFTPADVDLRRLLTLDDAYGEYNGRVYQDYQRPPNNNAQYYSSDYNRAGHPYDDAVAERAGLGAYGALRLSLRDGIVPPVDCTPLQNVNRGVAPFMLERPGRPRLYADLASAAEAAAFDQQSNSYSFGRPFGLADELELRTYHGVNDSSVTSRFEAAMAGRDPNPTGPFGGVSPHCPVRSNRPLALERGGRGDRWPTNPANPFPQADGRPDRDALLQAATDIRRLMTFYSGARPLRSVALTAPTDPIVGDRNGFPFAIPVPGGPNVGPANPQPNPVNFPRVRATRSEVQLDVSAALAKAADRGLGGSNATQQEGANEIFAAYATALLPYVSQDTASMWDDPLTSGLAQQYRTLAYGHRGPDLAMRIAAHMTANLIDMYDGTRAAAAQADEPTALRVFFTNPNNGGVPGGTIPVTGHVEVNLDRELDQQWLRPSSGGSAPAWAVPELRVYGIEAQPFLTEVAMFHMFTDAPTTAGGDVDAGFIDATGDGPTPDDELWKLTIDGEVSGTNPDFVMQCIAFQVYNPFDFAVDMTNFYFEFGSTIFVPQTGLLLPGQHKAFFALNPGRGIVNQRLQTLGIAGGNITTWLQTQLGIDPADLSTSELRRLDLDGNIVPPNNVRDLFDQADITQPPSPKDRVALLWRKFPVSGASTSGYSRTEREHHILADRLRDPTPAGTRSTWDRRFKLPPPPATQIGSRGGVVAGTESGPTEGDGDDTGFTITLYGTVVRPREVTAVAGAPRVDPPRGAVPSFCLERKAGWDPLVPSLNTPEDDGVDDPDTLAKDDFVGPNATPVGDGTITGLWTAQTGQAGVLPNVGVKDNPIDKATGVDPSAHAHRVGAATVEPNAYFYRYPEIHLNNNEFRAITNPGDPLGAPGELLRPADLLLPMGIGPSNAIGVPPSPFPGEHELERSWMTLSEALCLATGLDHDQGTATTSPPPESTASPQNPFHRLYEDVLDRGNLRLDWFVAYKDENPVATDFSRLPVFDPDADFAPYPAVPFAARVLEKFRVHPYGGERRAVPGLININTAPRAVLRLLPLFTPPYAGSDWIDNNSNVLENYQGQTSVLFPSDSSVWDIATTAKAYRDKLAVRTRLDRANQASSGRVIDFTDTVGATTPDGRTATQIDGLREEPGFSVPGEILALQVRGRTDVPANGGRPTFATQELGGGYTPQQDVNLDCSINRFGFSDQSFILTASQGQWLTQERSFRVPGIDSSTYDDPATPGQRLSDGIVNEYDEQLAIANAVLGSITTRSDLFCVWFVVHGYLPSDCEALGPQDPLVPSIARRYVMVVDRSNVQRPSDKPRILLFQEVPM